MLDDNELLPCALSAVTEWFAVHLHPATRVGLKTITGLPALAMRGKVDFFDVLRTVHLRAVDAAATRLPIVEPLRCYRPVAFDVLVSVFMYGTVTWFVILTAMDIHGNRLSSLAHRHAVRVGSARATELRLTIHEGSVIFI